MQRALAGVSWGQSPRGRAMGTVPQCRYGRVVGTVPLRFPPGACNGDCPQMSLPVPQCRYGRVVGTVPLRFHAILRPLTVS